MTSKIKIEDDIIQLIELGSNASSIDNISNNIHPSPKVGRFKKRNKIHSPSTESPTITESSTSKISDIFVIKPSTSKNEHLKKSNETLDTLSGDRQSIFSSETVSYKDKLRSRFLTLKKQAELSIIETDKSSKSSTKKKKRDDFLSAALRKQDGDIKAELHKYEEQRSIERNESYTDFFCNEIEDENDGNLQEASPKVNIESPETSNLSKQSVIDFFQIDHLESEIVEFLPPDQLDLSLYENEVFKPFNRYNKPINKDNLKVRNSQEDGLYKSDSSHISDSERNFLEANLSLEENKDWFDSDGELNILPDPRLDKSYKPFKTELKHSDFIKNYLLPTTYEPLENYINIYDNTLEITFHNITFKHHNLFSLEHVISQKLISLISDYKNLNDSNLYLFCRKKLDSLRSTKNRLKNQSGDCKEDVLFEKYNKLLREIKETREKMYEEAKKERDLKLIIINTWKTLKQIRDEQKYSSTNINLIIIKSSNSYEDDSKSYQENIEQEVSEIFDEYETLYNQEKQDYKSKLKLWKEQKQQQEDSSINSESIEKPLKPKRAYDKESITKETVKKCEALLREPGEPSLDFELKYDNEITDTVTISKEKLRRNTIKKIQLFVKISCNKREVCKTKLIPLNDTFVCEFNEIISMRIYKIPHILCLQIYEQMNQVNKRLLAELDINIPDQSITLENSETSQQFFINKDIISYNNLTAVGSGIDLKTLFPDKHIKVIEDNTKLFCSGFINFQIYWEKKLSLECHSSKEKFESKLPTLFDIESLENYLKNYPDPQDPKKSHFYNFIKNLQIKSDSRKDYFRCDPGLEPFEFCSEEEIEENLRFKLLKLRNQNEAEFKNMFVPNRVKEISPDIFKDYEKRKLEEKIVANSLLDQVEKDNIDAQRKWAVKYLKQAENRIIQLSKLAETRITLTDVLNEDFVPSLGSLGLSFINWLQPKRPLRPARKPSKKTSTAITFKEIKILVNIVGATQVPSRKDEWSEISPRSRTDQMSIVSVRPFVSVTFQGNCARTTVAEGPNPIWNQELNLPIRNKNDSLSMLNLQNIKDSITINLFDETVENLIMDDRFRNTNIHQQLGCNWLGKIEIPFSTLLYNNRIEGTFRVNLPPILLGYERATIRSFQAAPDNVTQKIDTFLSVFITLQPTIANIPPFLKIELECIESPYVEEHITLWQNQYNLLFPQRQFTSFVITMNGEKCCITRFLKPVKLPPFCEETTTDYEIAKYVALIPFRENNSIGVIPDIWLTSEQFLTLMMGSIKDHAVLLACYFMSLGIKCWLVIGYGLPFGYTLYVLIKEKTKIGSNFSIFDVKTGEKFNIYDNICPLQRVFCVFNDTNVWGNIQCDDHLYATRFDFSKSGDWLPLFDKNISAPPAFQNANPIYYSAPSVENLQERIEQKLKHKIMKWRKHSRTSWNIYCNASLKKILIKLEEKRMKNSEFIKSPEHLKEIHSLMASYQIRGFAVYYPYTTVNDLIEFVQSSGIYLNDHPNIEFSLACHIQSYDNNVLNVWLYLATLVKNR